ncbi:alpha/beta hydrolase [Psychroserpens sp. MEBiC05023]
MQDTVKVSNGSLQFDCRVAGNKDNELVIFLHGFPETSYMWINLMASISELGYYCVAPNLRGYSPGACPKGKHNYSLDKLVSDVIALSKHFDESKFHLVGHDWGAVIGWKIAHDYKESILSWTAISVPHIQAFGEAMMTNEEQHKMSAYVRRFQIPFLPELKIRKNDFRLFRILWKHSSPEEIADYLTVFRNKKQLTAAINYYRSNYPLLKSTKHQQILGDIHVPTLFIWGNKDVAIGSHSVSNCHKYMKHEYRFLELDSGHWLIQTSYDQLKEVITKHLTTYKLES